MCKVILTDSNPKMNKRFELWKLENGHKVYTLQSLSELVKVFTPDFSITLNEAQPGMPCGSIVIRTKDIFPELLSTARMLVPVPVFFEPLVIEGKKPRFKGAK